MLLYFKTSNNLSFQDEVEFSMVAGNFTEHQENTIPIEKYKIKALKSSVIYGANASGKSNLLKAITNGVQFIMESFSNDKLFNRFSNTYNLNDQRNYNLPTAIVFGVLIEGIQFEYSFAVNRERILEEQLLEYRTQKPIQHFHRKFDSQNNNYNWTFSSHFVGKKETVKDITSARTLFLTIGFQTELPVAAKVINWFKTGIVWGIDINQPGNLHPNFTLELLINHPQLKTDILKSLKEADFNINDLIIEKTDSGLNAFTVHKTLGKNGEDISTYFDLHSEESTGTKRFIAWIGAFITVLSKGQTLLIDELGTSMHTLLSKYLIAEFHLNRNVNSQLIFTTHDTNLMTQEIFRRDQIWIVEKDNLGNSDLYSLSEFKIKKGKVLENSYLQGVYGGIPHIQAETA